MPYTKEEKKEYNRLYRIENKEKKRLYYLKNKEKISQERKERDKLWRLKNKEKHKEYFTEYNKSEQGKKVSTIGQWRHRGILCFDFDLLYDIFLKVKFCEFCNVELNTTTKTKKCLDHDHSITDRFNVRGVLCRSCNIKDVLK